MGSRGSLGFRNVVAEGRCLRVGDEHRPGKTRHYLLEHRDPFARDARLEGHEPGQVAAWSREAGDEARAQGIADAHEHDRDRAGLAPQRRRDGHRVGEDHIWLKGDQLLCKLLRPRTARRIAALDTKIAILDPS
jgi:hypothetical protein